MSTASQNTIPTVDEVDQITAIRDPVIRNLRITLCYHELALALTARTGRAANWCTFATWASRQAGQTIRHEDVQRTLENLLKELPFSAQSITDYRMQVQALGSTLSSAGIDESIFEVLNPFGAFKRASDAVARGNRKVFEEIGREFARFYVLFLNDTHYDSEKIRQFCDTLRPGAPPDGQQYLRQAMTRYYQAMFETDPKKRAEMMLLANVEIGFHEQTRLQPEIAEAMNAAFVDRRLFRLKVIRALFPLRDWRARLRLFFEWIFDRPGPFDALLDGLLAEARRRARLLITEYMMTINFPHEVILRLGSDLTATYPDTLAHIDDEDLRQFLATVDTTPNSTHQTGAVDWSRLPDRLHYIVDLFRCYHESADLFECPFTGEQVAAMKAGQRPTGRL